jgi:hypothetical protein
MKLKAEARTQGGCRASKKSPMQYGLVNQKYTSLNLSLTKQWLPQTKVCGMSKYIYGCGIITDTRVKYSVIHVYVNVL